MLPLQRNLNLELFYYLYVKCLHVKQGPIQQYVVVQRERKTPHGTRKM
jgi:hypothetical protein